MTACHLGTGRIPIVKVKQRSRQEQELNKLNLKREITLGKKAFVENEKEYLSELCKVGDVVRKRGMVSEDEVAILRTEKGKSNL